MIEFSKISKLLSIKENPEISIDEIPELFHKDILSFLYGSTVKKNHSGSVCINRKDYFLWLKKIWLKGFDYPIYLNELR